MVLDFSEEYSKTLSKKGNLERGSVWGESGNGYRRVLVTKILEDSSQADMKR